MPALAHTVDEQALVGTYHTISEWLLYPEEIDPATLEPQAVAAIQADARQIDPRVAELLGTFHEQRSSVSAEQYLNLLELNPRFPLYLGTHQFEEPKSCSAAGLSDRNTYMLEIGNIYRHFGFELSRELPDFLPVMAEFLALSAGCDVADNQVRIRFIDKLMIAGVRLLGEQLGKAESPYRHLMEALVICLEAELEAAPLDDGEEAGAVIGVVDGQPLLQIEEAPIGG